MTEYFTTSDGVRLAYELLGEPDADPVYLIHGLYSSAKVNWIKFGHAQKLADAGYRVIMPDLRAHGNSAAPHDPAAYPADILARDNEELIAHLGLERFHLGGFSLGARTTARLILRGAKPVTATLAGMGLDGLAGWERRKQFFLEAIELFDTATRDDKHWLAIQFMKTMKVDRQAAKLLLQTFADTTAAELAAFSMPTLVICGADDRDNGDPHALADALPDATMTVIPGTHMSSVAEAALGNGILHFLNAHNRQDENDGQA